MLQGLRGLFRRTGPGPVSSAQHRRPPRDLEPSFTAPLPEHLTPRLAPRSKPLARTVASVILALQLGLSGCASVMAPLHGITAGLMLDRAAITEAHETLILGERNGASRMIEVHRGDQAEPPAITVHGVHSGPDSIGPITRSRVREGGSVYTFLYDDGFRRLTDSSDDLAGALERVMAAHPAAVVRIDAHSMGARIVLGALDALEAQGKLTSPIELRLIAPYLGGAAAADFAASAPDFLADAISGVRPGIDIGHHSNFQERLEALSLPPLVTTKIYVGDQDHLVDPGDPHFARVALRLGAVPVILPGVGHEDIVTRVAEGPL